MNTNAELEQSTARERILWAAENFGADALITTTSGGDKAALLPHLIRGVLKQNIPVIFVDTGFYPPHTHEMIEALNSDGFTVHIYKPRLTKDEIEEHYPLWYKDPDSDVFIEVLRIIKHEPFNRAIEELAPKVWLRGLCRYQSVERAQIPVFKSVNGLYHLHPIADWSKEEVDGYLAKHKLPRNPEHFDITKGEDQKRECGIGQE